MADFVILANESGDLHPEEPEVDESFSLRFANLDGEMKERERLLSSNQLVTIFTATLCAVTDG